MLPTFFLSHGSPQLALEPGPYAAAWRALVEGLPRPEAILVVSAHWTTMAPEVSLAARPATIHDFGGFPRALHDLQYPAPGAPALAAEVAGLLGEAGLPVAADKERGLDHGAWVPLRYLYPAADIPVTQLSVQPRQDAAWHLRVGEALQPLRRRNILVLASGSLTHNLHDVDFGAIQDERGLPYVQAFQGWMEEALVRHDRAALADWAQRAPGSRRAHPTPEHLLPLFVALGAAGAEARAERRIARCSGGALAMDCYAFS